MKRKRHHLPSVTMKHTFPRKKSELRWLRELSTTWRLDTWERRQTWQHGLERWRKKKKRKHQAGWCSISKHKSSPIRGPWRLPALGQEVHDKHHQVHTGPSLTVLDRERQFARQTSETSQNLKIMKWDTFIPNFTSMLNPTPHTPHTLNGNVKAVPKRVPSLHLWLL